MIVYVNNEERELHIYDRSSGVDYAKSVICSQERLDTGMMGEFILSEQEYDNWKEILQIVQESEDIRYALKDIADPDELKEYIDYLFKDIYDYLSCANFDTKYIIEIIDRMKNR